MLVLDTRELKNRPNACYSNLTTQILLVLDIREGKSRLDASVLFTVFVIVVNTWLTQQQRNCLHKKLIGIVQRIKRALMINNLI